MSLKIQTSFNPESSLYRLTHQDYFSIFSSRHLNDTTLTVLKKYIQINTDIDYSQEIIGIFPILKTNKSPTFILYRDYISIMAFDSLTIIRKFLNYYHHLDLAHYKKALSRTLDNCYKNLPIATKYYSFIPLYHSEKSDTIWINPTKIARKENMKHFLRIYLHNQYSFDISLDSRTLKSRVKKGLVAQALMKREYEPEPLNTRQTLLEYLHIQSTPLLQKLLADCTYTTIPGKRGDYTKHYLNIHTEDIIRKMI